ncbi:MAG: heavy metal-binding domain-containing protein [Chloroflexi bacterium]|nr:heavy metal-binding domain-containing protein [Chloroflexota bacterium]
MDSKMTTTTFDILGHKVVRSLGVVRGVTVRSRGLGGQVMAQLRTLGGGQIYEYVQLCEQSRAEAFDYMMQHADKIGANAVIGVRYDATDLGNNMTEVLAYGTAVVVEPE